MGRSGRTFRNLFAFVVALAAVTVGIASCGGPSPQQITDSVTKCLSQHDRLAKADMLPIAVTPTEQYAPTGPAKCRSVRISKPALFAKAQRLDKEDFPDFYPGIPGPYWQVLEAKSEVFEHFPAGQYRVDIGATFHEVTITKPPKK